MGILVILIILALIFIQAFATSSKKETKKERYAEAVGQFAEGVSGKIGGFAFSMTEPKDKKKLRLAKERLALKNTDLFYHEFYGDDEETDELFRVDEFFRKDLKLLGLSEDNWQDMARRLFHLGAIRKLSRSSSNYLEKLPKDVREIFMQNENYLTEALVKALNYFEISTSDWINYGDAVIEMYNLTDDSILDKFGYTVEFQPHQSNIHLI